MMQFILLNKTIFPASAIKKIEQNEKGFLIITLKSGEKFKSASNTKLNDIVAFLGALNLDTLLNPLTKNKNGLTESTSTTSRTE